jgi:hypothetical protein
MENPFETLQRQNQEIRDLLQQVLEAKGTTAPEVIDRPELCRRLAVTEPTVIRWEKAGKIPRMEIGTAIRYNWPKVVAALENDKNKR